MNNSIVFRAGHVGGLGKDQRMKDTMEWQSIQCGPGLQSSSEFQRIEGL